MSIDFLASTFLSKLSSSNLRELLREVDNSDDKFLSITDVLYFYMVETFKRLSSLLTPYRTSSSGFKYTIVITKIIRFS